MLVFGLIKVARDFASEIEPYTSVLIGSEYLFWINNRVFRFPCPYDSFHSLVFPLIKRRIIDMIFQKRSLHRGQVN